ncbi:MAG: hypothetical protein ABIH76_05485 [Candidatus Bathyarchaeota archaeon]
MSSFGFVSKSKYLKFVEEKQELERKVESLQRELDSTILERDKAIKKAGEASLKNKELERKLMPYKTENSELITKIDRLVEERELFQKQVQELTMHIKRHKKDLV